MDKSIITAVCVCLGLNSILELQKEKHRMSMYKENYEQLIRNAKTVSDTIYIIKQNDTVISEQIDTIGLSIFTTSHSDITKFKLLRHGNSK